MNTRTLSLIKEYLDSRNLKYEFYGFEGSDCYNFHYHKSGEHVDFHINIFVGEDHFQLLGFPDIKISKDNIVNIVYSLQIMNKQNMLMVTYDLEDEQLCFRIGSYFDDENITSKVIELNINHIEEHLDDGTNQLLKTLFELQ